MSLEYFYSCMSSESGDRKKEKRNNKIIEILPHTSTHEQEKKRLSRDGFKL